MSSVYDNVFTEEIGRFTIYCRQFYDDSWRVSLYFYGAIHQVAKFKNKEDALMFFDLKCNELKNLVEEWNGTREENAYLGDDILYST
jgi:hypothetical protein|nr:MAG TPA: hypothetical protein [Caudoviricetes sp.]